MTVTIRNQASLAYLSNDIPRTAISNIASVTMRGPLTAGKRSLSQEHRLGEELVFMLTVANSSSSDLTNVTLVDDLGTYTWQPSTDRRGLRLTPLSYAGPSHYYLDGVYQGEIAPTVAADRLTYIISALPAGSTAMIVHKLQVNYCAPVEADDTVTNTVTVTADCLAERLRASYTLCAAAYAQVSILKYMTPDPVQDGGRLTYNFLLYNYGNIPATGVTLTDGFSPAPAGPLVVTVNGQILDSADYDYADSTLRLPGRNSDLELTVPAATYTRNAAGQVMISPGLTRISVTGVI